MRFFLAIFLLCAGTANASIYHYKYQGHEMQKTGGVGPEYYADPGNNPLGYPYPYAPPVLPGFKLDVYINTAHLPGGVFGNIEDEWWDSKYSVSVKVVGNNGFEYWNKNPYPNIKFASFKFDSDKNVTDWRLGIGHDAPHHGPGTTTDGDYYMFWGLELFEWRSYQPGTWTLVSDDAVAPVPLPASALLLIGALSGLGAIRRLRKR